MTLKKHLLLSTLAVSMVMNANAQFKYPYTYAEDVVDNYFGIEVKDPYRWLENDTSAQTAQWVKSQQEFTNDILKTMPTRDKLIDRLTEVWNYPKFSAPSKHGNYYLIYKNDGLQNQSVLYIKKGINGKEEVLIDPNKLSKDGTVALQNVSISKNQKYIAYTVSASGSDWQEIYVMDLATKKNLSYKIEHVKFSSLAWIGDEGFYYSGYDKPKDEKTKYSAKTEYQKVFFHKIGQSQDKDVLVYEDKENPLRYVFPQVTEDNRFLILNISEGTDGSEIKVKDLSMVNAPFVTIVKGFNTNASVIDNEGDEILLLTNENAPNYKLMRIHTVKRMAPQIVVGESQMPLSGVSTAGGRLFLHYLKDATAHIVSTDYKGADARVVDLPGIGAASGFSGYKDDTEIYYTFSSFTTPSTTFSYDISKNKSDLYMSSKIDFDYKQYETKQVFVKSKDGTQVPMFIVYKKGIKLDGTNPTMLYGYGGFNISLTPSFSIPNAVFMEKGGVYCVVNLRGGAEYGEDWHRGGMLQNKQNVFDDFIACAEYLIDNKYTSPQRLAIKGGSNGGLLVGACMTQRPELFAVAIPQVGVLDMLRYHRFTVGWGWAVEYGTSDNKDQFEYLFKYSPLHNVREGVCYPATMITTADHDDRVVPAHSFKFAAELQSKQACPRNILIRIDSKAGHGAGKPTAKQIEEAADIMSFIFGNMNYTF